MAYPRTIKYTLRCNHEDLDMYQALAKVKNTKVSILIRSYLEKEIAENKEAIDMYLKKEGK